MIAFSWLNEFPIHNLLKVKQVPLAFSAKAGASAAMWLLLPSAGVGQVIVARELLPTLLLTEYLAHESHGVH